MNEPDVSVIIPVKNREKSIANAINSVLFDDSALSKEIVVVEDNCSDGTHEVVAKLFGTRGNVKSIKVNKNSPAGAKNEGLKIARGKYVTFVDSDDVSLLGKIDILSEFLDNNDDYIGVFGNTIARTPEGIILNSNFDDISTNINFGTLIKQNYIGSGSIMLRNVYDIKFDENMYFGEDYALWLDLIIEHKIGYVNFDTYCWTSGSFDGVGKNTNNWKELVKTNKKRAIRLHEKIEERKNKMKIAIFCGVFGAHPFGGPAIYGYNVVEMLYKHGVNFKMFYDCVPHSDYLKRKDYVAHKSEFNQDDFNVFYVMNDMRAIRSLNGLGIRPIIGSNHIPNSAPMHCLGYLTEEELKSRGQQAGHEIDFIKTVKGKFWLSQSRFQEREYRRLGLPFSTDVYVIGNPTDTELFRKTRDFGDKIIWSGKKNWAKHIEYLYRVAERLPDREFLCISESHIPSDGIKIPDNVEFKTGGTMFDVPNLLHKANIFLSTSVTENNPCGILEAMSTRLPCIAQKTSGITEVINDHQNGFMVSRDNIDHYVVEIERLSQDEILREKIGDNARRYVEDNYGYHSMYYKYMDLFWRYYND